MKYYDRLSPKQEEKTKDLHDSLDHHHLYILWLHRQSPDLIIPPLTLPFRHSPEKQFLRCLTWEDRADPSSSLTKTRPHHLWNHHQHHHQERERDRLFADQQAATYARWQRVCRIWDLRFRKGVMLRSRYLIIIRTIFHFNAIRVLPPSLFFVIAHSAIHVFLIPWFVVYMTHSIYLFPCTCISTDSCTYLSVDTCTSIDS